MTRMYLVFDVGGTKLRAALFDPANRQLRATIRVPTPSIWSLPGVTPTDLRLQLLQLISEMSDELLVGQRPAAVCVAFPGPIDPEGRVVITPTVWGGVDAEPFVPVVEFGRLWPSLPIRVINDVTAAGYRHLQNGGGDFCIVTVSSGIGHKVFVDGSEIVGPRGRGGEIGHWTIDMSPDAPRCDCGGRGHVGAMASGRGALLLAQRRAREEVRLFEQSSLATRCGGEVSALSAADLASCFVEHDPWTVRLITEVAYTLGRTLGMIHLTVGVESFVIVGGFALALGEPYRRAVADSARESCIDLGQDWDQMVALGSPDDDNGLIGAGLYLIAKIGDAIPLQNAINGLRL